MSLASSSKSRSQLNSRPKGASSHGARRGPFNHAALPPIRDKVQPSGIRHGHRDGEVEQRPFAQANGARPLALAASNTELPHGRPSHSTTASSPAAASRLPSGLNATRPQFMTFAVGP